MYANQPYELIAGQWNDVAAKTAAACARALTSAVNARGQAVVAIPGGRSVTRVLEAMKAQENFPWKNIELFWVDERWVPLEHEDSNFRPAWNAVLQQLVKEQSLHQDQVHPFRYSSDLPDGGVGLYQSEFRQYSAKSNEQFDLVVLGVGEDGHCASLFPHHDSFRNDTYGFITVHDSPKYPPDRMSASRRMIMQAGTAVLLFLGEGKRSAWERFQDSEVSEESCPAKIALHAGHTIIVTDLQ